METTFGRWLRLRGEAHYAYAVRKKIGKRAVAQLAGISREARKVTLINYTTLRHISNDTGIPIQTLIDDAARAARNPVQPRKYVKRAPEAQAADA